MFTSLITFCNIMDVKKESYIKQLHEAFGNVSKACKAVGLSRTTIYRWMQEDEEFKESVENINEYIVDTVENHLFDQIKDGSTAATIFYLKTKGKHRGYVEKTEVDNNVTVKEFNIKDLVKFE